MVRAMFVSKNKHGYGYQNGEKKRLPPLWYSVLQPCTRVVKDDVLVVCLPIVLISNTRMVTDTRKLCYAKCYHKYDTQPKSQALSMYDNSNTTKVPRSQPQRHDNRDAEAEPVQRQHHHRGPVWLPAQPSPLSHTAGSRIVAPSVLLRKQERFTRTPHTLHVLAAGDRPRSRRLVNTYPERDVFHRQPAGRAQPDLELPQL